MPDDTSFTGPRSEISHPVKVDLYMGNGPLMLQETRIEAEHPSGYHVDWTAGIPTGFRLALSKDGQTVAVAVIHETQLIYTLTDVVLAKLAEHNEKTEVTP